MSTHSRVRALALLAAVTLTLAGCGGGDSGDKGPKASPPSTSAPSATASEPSATASADGKRKPSPGTQVIAVDKYGISFELPKGWTSLDNKGILKPTDPAMRDFADKLGMTPTQVVQMFETQVETFSITDQGAVGGFVDNVNTTGVAQDTMTDNELKLGLATVGAKVRDLKHVDSSIGEITRATYDLQIRTTATHGVSLSVDVGESIATITVSSHSAAAADELAGQIVSSLEWIDPNRKGDAGA